MSLNTTKWAWFESFGRKGVPNKAKFRKHGNTEPRGGPPVPQGPERKGSPQLIEPEDIVNFEGSRRRDDWDGQEYRGGVVRNGVRQEWASISDLSCCDSLSPQTGESWESLDTSQHANSPIGLCRDINYQWTDRGKGLELSAKWEADFKGNWSTSKWNQTIYCKENINLYEPCRRKH